MMIQTQTFDFQDNKDELELISSVLDLLMHKSYDAAAKLLVIRHDQLTKQPKTKLYGT